MRPPYPNPTPSGLTIDHGIPLNQPNSPSKNLKPSNFTTQITVGYKKQGIN